MGRINQALLKKFEEDLKGGVLAGLLAELKQDDTLALEFRADYLSIYYRGGCISKLTYKEQQGQYVDYFDSNYESEEKENASSLIIKSNEECKLLVECLQSRKKIMNEYFRNKQSKMERQYQQIIEWENNRDESSNYTITDIEYQKSNDCRFDLIAVNRRRQKDYKHLKLSIIELKYGIGSVAGNSGVYKHYEDVSNLTDSAIMDLIEETKFIMNCKYELGLIKLKDSAKFEINIDTDRIDLIYFIGNVPMENRNKVLAELEKINNSLQSSDRKIAIDVKVFCPYLTGNVMFDHDILTIEEFLKVNKLREDIAGISAN